METSLVQTIVAFIKKYIMYIAPAILLLLLIGLFSFSLSQPQQKKTTSTTTPIPTQANTNNSYKLPIVTSEQTGASPETTGTVPDGIAEEESDMTWSPEAFSESELSGVSFNKTVRPDGSIKYTSETSIPGRSTVTIVKNGIVILQSKPMFNVSISDYNNFFGKPDYTAYGSQFWGPNTITYVYMKRGAALTVNENTNAVVEQLLFQPVDKDVFKQLYESDITGPLQ